MNLEHYRNFVKIVDTGTISSAARQLLIPQPSLSKQIKAIEKAFGTQLLKRGVRNIELTNAGQIFYEKAKLICSIDEMAQNEINASILGNKGTLRIGFTSSYPDLFVDELLKDFASLHPHIIYEIYEASSDELMDLIKDNIIEVGIVRTPTYINPIFKAYKGIEEQLMAVFHKDNPWFSPAIKAIHIQQLQGIPLSISRGFNEKVVKIFSDAGFPPTLFSVCSSRPTTLMWARHNCAVGLVTTNSAKALESDILHCRPIIGGDMSARRSFTILKKHDLSSVAKSFLNFATEEALF